MKVDQLEKAAQAFGRVVQQEPDVQLSLILHLIGTSYLRLGTIWPASIFD
jgi:hypothetical protein